MGLSSILSIATSGLGATQAGLDVVSRNVANANTPGYSAKSYATTNNLAGTSSVGVLGLEVTRAVDRFLQSQLRIETSALGEAEVINDYLRRLDELFGAPGSPTALDTLLNEFTQALGEVTATPDSYAAREEVIGSAVILAQQLNQLSNDIQVMRQQAEDTLAQAVADVNSALKRLDTLNDSLAITGSDGTPAADLLDERDKLIDQVAQYLAITVREQPNGTVSIFTAGGNALLEGEANTLVFDHHPTITANAEYSTDPAERGVGTIALVTANGYQIDLIGQGILDSGRIGGLVELRDTILVQAQAQLDELAHGLATALSSQQVGSAAVSVGAQDGFDIDLAGLLAGNTVSLSYTETPPGTTSNVTIVRVDDASVLPLSNDVTPDPNDTVIGIDFSGGMAAAAAALDAALGASISVSLQGASTFRILDDGAAGTIDINSLSATVTATSVQAGDTALPLFVDGFGGNNPYSGSFDNNGQKTGFAGRIAVNALVSGDNELLVRYASTTPLGDTSRPLDLLARLTETPLAFSPASGIGVTANPFNGTVVDYAQSLISFQAGRAQDASRAFSAQSAVATALSERFQADVAVDINKELAALIELQNAFAANARIVQVVGELYDIVLQM